MLVLNADVDTDCSIGCRGEGGRHSPFLQCMVLVKEVKGARNMAGTLVPSTNASLAFIHDVSPFPYDYDRSPPAEDTK